MRSANQNKEKGDFFTLLKRSQQMLTTQLFYAKHLFRIPNNYLNSRRVNQPAHSNKNNTITKNSSKLKKTTFRHTPNSLRRGCKQKIWRQQKTKRKQIWSVVVSMKVYSCNHHYHQGGPTARFPLTSLTIRPYWPLPLP